MGNRGCGQRQAGGVYLSCPLSSGGMPVDWFLLDPPFVIASAMEEALGLSDVGVKLIKRPEPSTVYDVWDIVGQNNYPNVADMIMEIKGMGVSRRIAVTEEFALLSTDSRLVLMHRKAHIENFHDYYGSIFMESDEMAETGHHELAREISCPRRTLEAMGITTKPHHEVEPDGNSSEMCSGLYFDDVVGGERQYDPGMRNRTVLRHIGDTTYVGRERPENIEPDYRLAIFGKFPIRQIDVIRDRSTGKHEVNYVRASASEIPISIEDE